MSRTAETGTLTPYRNSVVIAFCSTALCVLVGAMAAYALARVEYRPKLGTILISGAFAFANAVMWKAACAGS